MSSPKTFLIAFTVILGLLGAGVVLDLTELEGATETCIKRFPIRRDDASAYVQYCSGSLATSDPHEVRRIVFVIHGDSRNYEDYYRFTREAIAASGATGTLVVAPAFFTEGDIREHAVGGDTLYWSSGGWKVGNLSQGDSDRLLRVSSFEVLDQFIAYFQDNERFPNVHDMVVVGHSAGGQYVQRYAAISPTYSDRPDLRLRYIVANPSSYLYLDEARYRSRGDRIGFGAVPSRVRRKCSDFNTYKYGLKSRNSYAENIEESQIRRQYAERSVTYLIGENDTDTTDDLLDRSCPANLQGRHRRERAYVYERYLGYFYGTDVYEHHRFVTVSDVGHNARNMLNSDEGRRALFGEQGP